MVHKPEVVIESLLGENPDISLLVEGQDMDQVKEEIQGLPEIDQVIYYSQKEAYYHEHQVMLNVTKDFSKIRSKKMLYEGRYPKYDDEIAINGLMAKENDIAIGDEIELTSEGTSQRYLVSGYIQSASYMGYDISILEDGIKRLQQDFQPTLLYIYGNGLKDNNTLKEQFLDTYANYPTTCMIFDDQVQSTMGVFQSIISMFTLIILIMSFILISLILYLMTQTIIVHRRQEMGIQKAIGFTTRQLQFQIVVSFLPELCFGSILGGAFAFFFTNPICSSLFSMFGWMKVGFEFPWYFIDGIVVIICTLAFLMIVILTRKIRHITPYTFLIE